MQTTTLPLFYNYLILGKEMKELAANMESRTACTADRPTAAVVLQKVTTLHRRVIEVSGVSSQTIQRCK